MQPPEQLVATCERLLATAQAEQRVPSVSAAVFRDGGVLWQGASGLADVASGEEVTPRLPTAWWPDEGPPAEIAPLLGRWWSEGLEHVVAWNGGRLRIELLDGPAGRDVSWLRPEGEERWRVEEGRELGELLRLVRDDAGALTKLYFATYPMTRVASTFATSASA